MRRLFRITVVDPRTERVYETGSVVAVDEKQALLKADLPEEVRTDPSKYDFCVEDVGPVRARKETQKVEVVKPDE